MNVKDMFVLDGKTAVITGGSVGLGAQMATALAEAGANVVIAARKVERCVEMCAQLEKTGVKALAVACDVSKSEDCQNLVDVTVKEFGALDILVNNAGIIIRDPSLQLAEDSWDKVINVNLKGCYLCSRAVGRIMVERKKGNIINIASEAGFRALPFRVAYSVSKAGVIMLTRVLARELGSYNIRVNAIAPWIVKTRINEALLSDLEFTRPALANTPLGRFGETDDVTGIALFLASDAASWITGQTIVADGGYIA